MSLSSAQASGLGLGRQGVLVQSLDSRGLLSQGGARDYFLGSGADGVR
jgi:hypothetical protein